jgi:uncharacterized membrane-anchored protein
MYIISIAPLLCLTYLILLRFYPHLFNQPRRETSIHRIWTVCAIILAVETVFFSISFSLGSNVGIGNRLLHAMGGGFTAFLVSYFATRDSGVQLTRIQFFIISALVVTALGVGNELAEFFFQETIGTISAQSTIDTWQDLLSNTIGLILAASIFTPLHKKSRNALDHI